MFEYWSDRVDIMRLQTAERKFLICLNGYPEVWAATFDDAVDKARRIWPRSPDVSISIYEIETRIHFNLV